MVIDDDPGLLRAYARALHRFDVTTMSDAREALWLLNEGARFDLIISDLVMPAMSGMRFYELLRELAPDQASVVIFASGSLDAQNVRAFLASCS